MSIRECLSENLLDVNFVKLISPIYSIQLILGSNCVVISGNHVSTITLCQKLFTILWIIAVTGSLYYFEFSYYNNYYDEEKTLYYTFAFGLLVQYLSYLLNLLHARFYKTEQTVEVFLKIQNIDRALKAHNMTSLGAANYYINILWVGYIIACSCGGFSVYVIYNIENPLATIPIGCAIINLYLELVLTGSCNYYLALQLRFLNNVIRSNILNKKRMTGCRNTRELNSSLTIVSDDGTNNNIIKLKDFSKILTSILKLFHSISNLFMFELFNVVVTVFIWTFLVIESTVVGLRTKLVPILTSVILVLWIVFYFIQIATVAYTCDWFAKQVQDTKSLVVQALSVYCEDKDVYVRKASWELLQLIEFEKPIFSVYGIFVLNMKLPLKLISVITTNVLVFIQYTSNALNTN